MSYTFKYTGRVQLAVRISRLAFQVFWDDPQADWVFMTGEYYIADDGQTINATIVGNVHVPSQHEQRAAAAMVSLKASGYGDWESVSVIVGRQNQSFLKPDEYGGRFWCGEYPPDDPKRNELLPVYRSFP